MTWRASVLTLFPEMFPGPLGLSLAGRALREGRWSVEAFDIRGFATDRHRTVDDTPFGGGAGMVMKPAPFFEAVESLAPEGRDRPRGAILLMSARGKRFTHEDAVRLSLEPEITLLCGHYKDVDQRVAEGLATEEVCLGDFIVSGGEIPALAVVDAVVRLLPGAISDHESAATDSFYDGWLSPPSYTRPAEFRGMGVPPVLLSGDHARIAAWRRDEAERLTRQRRPELLERPETS